ncbi:MAG: SDR family oxidoreductase [Deltaproteobacteria bacterium]|nr:SDR family oxidoreductase [Deltaproteobacteria bacterium]
MDLFSLQGKKAFISGAGQGLGREMALTLAEAGADVALASRNRETLSHTADLIRKMGREVLVCPMDLTRIEDIDQAVNDTIATFGRIDILINNSGISKESPVIDMTPEKWDPVMDVNLRGHVFCSKAVGRHMMKNNCGKIINIASIMGLIPLTHNSSYGAAKAGLILFTKTLALEWARYNIQVNAICPGYFLTDLNREFFESPMGQKVIKKIPMRRIADAKELRGVTLLLASEASSFMTGTVIVVDGGHILG